MPLTGSFVGIGVRPRILSAVALSTSTVRVNFNEAMSNDAALVLAGNYTITPAVGSAPRAVTGVVTDGLPNPLAVILTLDGDLTPGVNNYTVTVAGAVLDVAGNGIDPAFDDAVFNGLQVDFGAPFITNLNPLADAVNVPVTSNIQLDVLDTGEGINLSTLDISLNIDGVVTVAVDNGVIQGPYGGSINAIANGYRVIIDPPSDFTTTTTVTVLLFVSDNAGVPNSFSTSYRFFTFIGTPISRLAQSRFDALLGSIIQLDGRDSSSPEGLPLIYEWVFRQVPDGSVFEADVDVINPASITDLRPSTFAAMSFIPDRLGRYIVELRVTSGSTSICTALVEVGLTRALAGTGKVPDAKFLWSFVSNFYSLLEDREYFEVGWSAFIQLFGADYVRLWSNDYNKSLSTIQPTVQRRWIRYLLHRDVSALKQRVIVGNTMDGSTAQTGDIGAPGANPTSVVYTQLSNEDFTQLDVNYGAKGRIIDVNGEYFTISRVYNVTVAAVDYSVVIVDQVEVINNQSNVPFRIPHLIHFPGEDLEVEGVQPGDELVLEWRRGDTGQIAEMSVRIFAVDRERIGFEFNNIPLSPGAQTIDYALFEQLVQELRIVPPTASSTDVAKAANALIAFIPVGINLSAQPFTTYQITVRAARIIHNNRLKIDDLHVSIPYLQEEIRENPPVVLRENFDYILVDRTINGTEYKYLEFASGLFSLPDPAPLELWAECVHIDNGPTIEANFGRLVELTREDLQAKATRAPYLPSVQGLWYALTNGPSVENVRLGLQILMGLPFTTTRGRIIAITPNFSVDSFGQDLGRILTEDVDEKDRTIGTRRFYFYPMLVGIEPNPTTGVAYIVGDIVEAFRPLSGGVTVTDYVKDPIWWIRSLANNEILKFFLFQAQIDTASGVFNEEDLIFSLEFIRKIKPVYTEVIASVLQVLTDDPLDQFADVLTGDVTLNFYEDTGLYGGLESNVRDNDLNQQGGVLWAGNGRPFSTRSLQFLRDVITVQDIADVEATSVTGFGTIRPRVAGSATRPTIEGDLLLIHPGQPGAAPDAPRMYEITASAGSNGPITLGSEAPFSDPPDWDLDPPAADDFPYGSGLRATVLRRHQNPVVQGTNLQTIAGAIQIAESIGALFVSNCVQLDDHLVIESGANAGEYRIVSRVAQTTPRNYLPAGVPQISETQVGLVTLAGVNPALTNLTGQEFRIIKPHLMKTRIEGVRIVQSGGNMWAEVFDPGASGVPFDCFTPGMVNVATLVVQSAQNPLNNNVYTILEYSHAGRVRITTGAPQTSDTVAQAIAIIRSPYHPGIEKASELTPSEIFSAVVS